MNPELARRRMSCSPLGEERQKYENTLSVLQMNLQFNRTYLARTTRPADGQIAEKDRQRQLLELSMGLDPRATASTVAIAVSASEGVIGDEIFFRAILSPVDSRARYGSRLEPQRPGLRRQRGSG